MVINGWFCALIKLGFMRKKNLINIESSKYENGYTRKNGVKIETLQKWAYNGSNKWVRKDRCDTPVNGKLERKMEAWRIGVETKHQITQSNAYNGAKERVKDRKVHFRISQLHMPCLLFSYIHPSKPRKFHISLSHYEETTNRKRKKEKNTECVLASFAISSAASIPAAISSIFVSGFCLAWWNTDSHWSKKRIGDLGCVILFIFLSWFLGFCMSRTPNYEFQEWWNKQRERNHDEHLLEKSDNLSTSPAFLSVEIRSSGSPGDRMADKDRARTRSARQISWVWLLKFQQIAGSLASITNGVVYLIRTANRRISSPDSPADSASSRLYRIIKVFLIVVLLLLVFELVAYFNGWHFSPPSVSSASAEVLGMIGFLYANWLQIRANYLAPPLQYLTNLCIVLFLIQSVDRLLLMFGCFWIKFRRLKPVAAFEYSSTDENAASPEDYPMVLVQIPMCNERR